MFTGLISAVGTLVAAAPASGGTPRITVRSELLAPQLRVGDSVSVSGVCLTAIHIHGDSFQADLAAETLARTTLGALPPGAQLNLELPTPAGAPLGGHVVQGHVDGVAELLRLARLPGAEDWELSLSLPPGLEKYVAAKGSIAIEGISLTIATVTDAQVTIAVIPHTYAVTNLRTLAPGDRLNVEVDILAKYAERRGITGVTLDALIRQGF